MHINYIQNLKIKVYSRAIIKSQKISSTSSPKNKMRKNKMTLTVIELVWGFITIDGAKEKGEE